nr:nucleoporin nup53 [Quercus suber]
MNNPANYQRSRRGMQVHAVPENERAYDGASGKKLPWGYSSVEIGANGDSERAREPAEKGPFGRSMRRSRSGMSRSRSKTAEPRREEDRYRTEQLVAEEAVFGSLRKVVKDDSRRDALVDVDPNTVTGTAQNAAASITTEMEPEATEIMLYGFGSDLQWAAIDFYERVSDGYILEDYERQPSSRQNFETSRSYGRNSWQKSLGKAALRKKNRFAGGDHWIKVTFDSRPAAELACARSPHIIKGHIVFAEPYQGKGPGRDEPIRASQAGAQITSDHLPLTFSTQMDNSPGHSTTATSATQQTGFRTERSSTTLPDLSAPISTQPGAMTPASGSQYISAQIAKPSDLTRRGLRIEGATRAVLLPPERALMPKAPKKSWVAWVGGSELIGTTVPKKEDGTFDWKAASYYWLLFYCLDYIFGFDICGLKTDE